LEGGEGGDVCLTSTRGRERERQRETESGMNTKTERYALGGY